MRKLVHVFIFAQRWPMCNAKHLVLQLRGGGRWNLRRGASGADEDRHGDIAALQHSTHHHRQPRHAQAQGTSALRWLICVSWRFFCIGFKVFKVCCSLPADWAVYGFVTCVLNVCTPVVHLASYVGWFAGWWRRAPRWASTTSSASTRSSSTSRGRRSSSKNTNKSLCSMKWVSDDHRRDILLNYELCCNWLIVWMYTCRTQSDCRVNQVWMMHRNIFFFTGADDVMETS